MVANWQLRETTWSHAANFISLYDAAGTGFQSKPAIKKAIQLTITEINPKLVYRILNKGDRIALLLPDHQDLYRQKSKDHLRAEDPNQVITDDLLKVNKGDLQPPDSIMTSIAGYIEDKTRFYNPRYFSINLQPLDINDPYRNAMALYRNVNAIQVSAAGSVRGNLELLSGPVAAWALITLLIKLDDDHSLEIKSQANQAGDFVIPLTELPALEPDSLITAFAASLTVQLCAITDNRPDPDQLTDVTLKLQSADANGVDAITFEIKYGQHIVLTSVGHSSLVVKT